MRQVCLTSNKKSPAYNRKVNKKINIHNSQQLHVEGGSEGRSPRPLKTVNSKQCIEARNDSKVDHQLNVPRQIRHFTKPTNFVHALQHRTKFPGEYADHAISHVRRRD